jgi:hypothetical protein
VATAGAGNPILSMVEDGLAGAGVIVAILAPIFAALVVITLVALGLWFFRRRRARAAILPGEAPYPR